jgi:flagellar P-ring protein FlgI
MNSISPDRLIRLGFALLALLLVARGPAQLPPGPQTGTQTGAAGAAPDQLTPEEKKLIEDRRRQRALADQKRREDLLTNGIEVRLGDIGGFRGAQSNAIMGYGLVVGLAGTGDTRQTPFTAKLLANALSRFGTMVKPEDLQGKNTAAVSVTATLPPFAAPGRKVDITVSSIGDAKSLEGGFLLPTPVTSFSDPTQVFLMGSGPLSIGGFEASAGGSSQRKNHQTVGRVPQGGDVVQTVPTQFIFEGGKVHFDLEEPDFTTAERAAQAINEQLSGYTAVAADGVTITVVIPSGTSPVAAVSAIESVKVKAVLPATVVINERTGTIVVGGNVKLGPAVIAHGSLQVRIEPEVVISQPAPLSSGQTVVAEIPRISASEDEAQIALTSGTATLDDMARILQTLKVSAKDIIAILQALASQGALKARIKIQ